MVPIVSQTLLRARCRYCGNKISWRYAYIEALTGVLFALAGLRPGAIQGGYITGIWAGDPVILLRDLLVISCLVVIFWIDYETLMIPLSSALLIGLAGVGADAWGVWSGTKTLTTAPFGFFDALPAALPESIVAMAVAAAIIWAVRAGASAIYRREAMGFGDVFLVAAIAANIGWSGNLLLFFFLSSTLGSFIGLALRVPHAIRVYRRGRARDVQRQRKKPLAGALARHAFRLEMPFGPMLAVGAFVTLLWGTPMIESYMKWANPSIARMDVRSNRAILTQGKPGFYHGT
jgi:leader peptidase (prepilin peptidase)/N-methyltransferase